MKLRQTYGPLIDAVPELKEYLNVSEQTFILASELGGNSPADWGTLEAGVLSLLMYHSLNASLSVRLLTTFAQPIEAFALLRIRFEQVIVSSYLINSDKKEGFDPFISDINRTDYRYSQAIKNIDPTLYGFMEKIFKDDIELVKLKTFFNERSLDPSFDFDKDQLKSNWTNLKKYDMCIKRDKLVDKNDPIQSIKLSQIYLSIYKSASIYIHCETGILTENFLSNYKGQLSPNIVLVLTNLINVAQLDLIQNYEILKFIKPNKTQKLIDLYSSYNEMVLRDYQFIIDKIVKAL
ncbi:MAG: DUF5677 domain-containing protein [Ignavibacteriaceae bacterium]|nr:DUF5677 domain-containing protein [Ignavibacteriaceae bacterium]